MNTCTDKSDNADTIGAFNLAGTPCGNTISITLNLAVSMFCRCVCAHICCLYVFPMAIVFKHLYKNSSYLKFSFRFCCQVLLLQSVLSVSVICLLFYFDFVRSKSRCIEQLRDHFHLYYLLSTNKEKIVE